MFNYKVLVLQLLKRNSYPSLEDFVIFDFYFKSIPTDYPSTQVTRFDFRHHDPMDQYIKSSKPFQLSYLVAGNNDNSFYLHQCKDIDAKSFPVECRRIKLSRFIVDTVVEANKKSDSFEQEIYNLVTLINFDLPKVYRLLDFSFIDSTRILPQYIDMQVSNYKIHEIKHNTVGTDKIRFYGPVDENSLLPVRVVRGRLAPCTSRCNLLSLNDDIGAEQTSYTMHLVPNIRGLVPLAYNPLENPIISSVD